MVLSIRREQLELLQKKLKSAKSEYEKAQPVAVAYPQLIEQLLHKKNDMEREFEGMRRSLKKQQDECFIAFETAADKLHEFVAHIANTASSNQYSTPQSHQDKQISSLVANEEIGALRQQLKDSYIDREDLNASLKALQTEVNNTLGSFRRDMQELHQDNKLLREQVQRLAQLEDRRIVPDDRNREQVATPDNGDNDGPKS